MQPKALAIAYMALDLLSEVRNIDHHLSESCACQGFKMPLNQGFAANGKHGLWRLICQWAHPLPATGCKNHGVHTVLAHKLTQPFRAVLLAGQAPDSGALH